MVHRFANVFKEIYFLLTLTLSPPGGEGTKKEIR
jgi:hypothetical protein